LILRSEGFERGFSKGHPSPCEKRDASLHRPCGLIRSNPPVLGAASGEKTIREMQITGYKLSHQASNMLFFHKDLQFAPYLLVIDVNQFSIYPIFRLAMRMMK